MEGEWEVGVEDELHFLIMRARLLHSLLLASLPLSEISGVQWSLMQFNKV